MATNPNYNIRGALLTILNGMAPDSLHEAGIDPLCLAACPVDAIVGGAKRMHTVIDPLCTGCELCIPVCPVDCISLVNVTGERSGWQAWSEAQATEARTRYAFHAFREERDERERNERLASAYVRQRT